MTRKTFLKTAMLAPGVALKRSAAADVEPAAGHQDLTLQNDNHRLSFDPGTGGIVSLTARHAVAQEFIPQGVKLPVLRIQFLDELNIFRQIDSLQAEEIKTTKSGQSVHMSFRRLGGHDLHAVAQVRLASGDEPSYWSVALENRTGLRITDLQFPFLVFSYDLKGTLGRN